MILKGRESYFKTPGVVTRNPDRARRVRNPFRHAHPFHTISEKSLGKGIYEMAERMERARSDSDAAGASPAPLAGSLPESAVKKPASSSDFQYYERRDGKRVLRFSYDAEIRRLKSSAASDPILLPKSFLKSDESNVSDES